MLHGKPIFEERIKSNTNVWMLMWIWSCKLESKEDNKERFIQTWFCES